MKVQLDKGAFMPERAHATDAGADIRTPRAFTVPAHDDFTVQSGVHVQLPPNTVGMLKSKSGLNISFGITSEGVIDEGYTGEIVVKLYNHSDRDHHFDAGDKISQLIIMPVLYPTFEQADEIEGGERGDAGFGSTGK